MITTLVYVLVLAVLLMLSWTLPNRPWRKATRVAATAMAVPLVLIALVGLGLLLFIRVTAPPTLNKLQEVFPRRRPDLETLLRMSDQDSRFRRIDPEFLDQMATDGTLQGRYMQGDPKSELPEARWEEYRALFKRNHIEQGIERDDAQDAFFRFGAQGLLDRGFATGIVVCKASPSTSETPVVSESKPFRYEPCLSNEVSGSGYETDNPHKEAFAFQKLDGHWYAYSQGPG